MEPLTPKQRALMLMQQQRNDFAQKAAQQEQYKQAMDRVHPTRQPTFEQWKATQGFAKGGSEKALHFPPAPALSQAEINAHAERMARQIEGIDNPNKKTQQQLAREQNLPVTIKGAKKADVPVIDYEKLLGSYTVGVPGDPSRGGVVPSKGKKRLGLEMPKAGETLHAIGGEKLDTPVPLYGGKDYGAYGHPAGWASDLGASAGMFNVVKRLAEENPERAVYGHYHKMSPESLNHAVHMLDAVLSHHRPHESSPEQIEMLNHLMRNVATTTGKSDVPYPTFPGFENPAEVMLHGSMNSGMRKKIIGLLGKEKNFPGGKQKLDDIIYAISHPELRNIETGAGGNAVIKFDPTRELRESISPHPTYGHDIPSELVGKTRYITPMEILAPRSYNNSVQRNIGKPVMPFNDAKMNIIREPIDQQYVDQMKAYEDAMRKRLGYAKGGNVEPSIDEMQAALAMKKPVHLAIGGQGPKNWMKGGIDRILNSLKQRTAVGDDPAETLAEMQKVWHPEAIEKAAKTVPTVRETIPLQMKELEHKAHLNNWIQSNLGNYIRKQMGTHNDPIRALAEQGILHVAPDQIGINRWKAEHHRANWDAPKLGKSEHAQAWEDATDVAMRPHYVSHLEGSRREPWMDKVDPSTKVFAPTNSMDANALGFDHLIDILKQDMAEGRMRPEQLSKVSMEQAVRRAHEYNEERKRKMAETALKATEGMPVHKDYGNGFRWLELALDKNLPEGWSQHPSGTYTDPEGVNHVQHPNYSKLEEALKYEGDTMGHCVGGYCPDVASGNTRIFSLRDKKNEPHVTVEVKPNQHLDYNSWFSKQPEEIQNRIAQRRMEDRNHNVYEGPEYLAAREELLPIINQIKGKGNAKPVAKYIPYAQDFVKSGNWSHVNDLHHTDLRNAEQWLNPDTHKEYLKHGLQVPKYGTEEDFDAIHKQYQNLVNRRAAKGGIIRKAGGGDVNIQQVGAEEAPNLPTKDFILPHGQHPGQLPVGGIDMQPAVPGQQLWPTQPPGQQPQQGQQQPPQGAQPPQGGPAPQGAPKPTSLSNILQMTPQGRALGAMQPQQPQQAKKGGTIKPVGHGITKEKVTISPNLDAMQYELMSVKHFKKAK